MLRSARALISSGLVNHGWSYINIDDTWQGERGGPHHAILPNERFPDMKGLCEQIHVLGLKVGIYSSPWITTFAGYRGGSSDDADGRWERLQNYEANKRLGKYSFATNDAAQFGEWGMDYLKYDWNPNDVLHTREMAAALRMTGRDIVFSLSCAAPFEHASDWARLANCWRTTGDIGDAWGQPSESWKHGISEIAFSQQRWVPYAGPGHWNDADMLEVGYVGGGPNLHGTHLTPDEQHTHLTMWCLLSAPLLIGCDLERLDAFTLSLLSNDEVLAVDQDALGKPAIRVASSGAVDLYLKNLEDGAKAVGFFNHAATTQTAEFRIPGIGGHFRQHARDLWRQVDLADIRDPGKDTLKATVAGHGAELYKLVPVSSGVPPARAGDKDLGDYAEDLSKQLREKIMPYWFDTGIDRANGGYMLSDDAARKARPAAEKQLVTQARMIWGFSQAHLSGLDDARHNYLEAAAQGYRFLLEHFLDRTNGGFYWITDLPGHPLNRSKILYGQSFVIYAMVEYYRASGEQAALENALALYQLLQKHAHDPTNGGWTEHFEADWTPILQPGDGSMVEIGGLKSANTHLHLMEALSELYDASHDAAVRSSLEEALQINKRWFYPQDASASALHRNPDWSPVTPQARARVSYGHSVEFAWLMVRAERVLGREPSWDLFEAHLDRALKYGYDHKQGGLYTGGFYDEPADDTDKVWWAQAEMLAALTDGLLHKENPAYLEALAKLLEFVLRYQANPSDGIWLDTVTASGRPKVTTKAHNWKANYHDVRGIMKFVEAFQGEKKRADGNDK